MSVTARQILESLPSRFRPEKAKGYSGVVHFDISGDELLQYSVLIHNEKCELKTGLTGKADCVVITSAVTYIELETGKANPQTALMHGTIEISNIAALLQFVKCFKKFEPPQQGNQIAADYAVRKHKEGPLAGIKILDFTRLLPGPMATMFLADMGADVIKIEDPHNPDYIRGFEPQVANISMYYLALNRSKRSLAVNYLSVQGKQIIYDLVTKADVLVEQFRPGVMDELGFGYQELSKINPRLIYVAITGYGQDSSLSKAAGHDLNYIAMGGALGITGYENELVIPGFQLGDIGGGSYLAMNAVMAAIIQRHRTGKGEFVDVAMTDGVLPFTVLQFARHQATKVAIPAGQFELSGALPNYNIYRCSDGKYVALGSLEPKFWTLFCGRVGRKDWAEKFVTQGPALRELKNEVRELFATKTSVEWVGLLQNDDICFTVVHEIADLENNQYLNERKMFVNNERAGFGSYKTINQPLKFRKANFDNNWNAPDLGEDTMAILRELNYNTELINELRQNDIVKIK